MDYYSSFIHNLTRRAFLKRSAGGIGVAALASLLDPAILNAAAATQATTQPTGPVKVPGALGVTHFAPKAKRIIYLCQSGAPSQIELFDPKPALDKLRGTDLPNSVRNGQRLTGMSSGQANFPVANSMFKFARHGKNGTPISELLPHTASIADDICVIRSLHTEAINHDPAMTLFHTGAQQAGRPSVGAWSSYGLGSDNSDLPAYVVMISRGSGRPLDQPLYDRLWGAGFLPTRHQGVKFRGVGDPVLFLSNPPGVDDKTRRRMLDDLGKLNQQQLDAMGDPEIATRISQYELAYRMQTAVPELTDLSKEPAHVLESYGPDVTKRGSYAANCLLARRLSERGVRFVQLFHTGWDQHDDLPNGIRGQCKDTDQPSAALIKDLKSRGLLDETLVIWSGEFGRTTYGQGKFTADTYGRDHHPRCFSMWMAGGGIKGGITHGETDDFSYNIVKDPVHVHDLNATILHCLGIDHTRLTFRFQGRHYRLTDVHGEVVKGILA
ncbi:MAG TPA: DUF1501 domain-containing protein [Tepidisphaeraceae bacterium]|jgi:hypothetical protein